MKSESRNLLLDLDGTLIGVNESRARLEFSIRWVAWWKERIGPWQALAGLRSLVRAVKTGDGGVSTNYERGIRVLARQWNQDESAVEALLELCLRDVFYPLKKRFHSNSNAQEFVNWASNHFNLYLVTNPVWPPELVQVRLAWAGIPVERFRSFTHAKRMTHCKPSPRFFTEFLSQESLQPESCIMIGNSEKEDGIAASVGIRTFILTERLGFSDIRTHLEEKFGL